MQYSKCKKIKIATKTRYSWFAIQVFIVFILALYPLYFILTILFGSLTQPRLTIIFTWVHTHNGNKFQQSLEINYNKCMPFWKIIFYIIYI